MAWLQWYVLIEWTLHERNPSNASQKQVMGMRSSKAKYNFFKKKALTETKHLKTGSKLAIFAALIIKSSWRGMEDWHEGEQLGQKNPEPGKVAINELQSNSQPRNGY